MRFTLKEDPKWLATIGAFFVVTWITMLSVGALGHQLHQPELYQFGYWTVALVKIAASGIVKASYVTKWIGESK